DAFERLLRQVGPGVQREIARKISPRHEGLIDADDVMQVTYVEAFLRIGSFVRNHPASFEMWLRRVAENNLIDAIRHEKPERRIANSDTETTLFQELTASTSTASRKVSEDEARSAVRSAMKTLPADYARVLQLFELDGKSGPEIAQIMG